MQYKNVRAYNLCRFCSVVLSVVLLLTMVTTTFAKPKDYTTTEDRELWNELKPLSTTVTFLNTGAHPDDERSDFLAYLSRGLGVKTASLIANRGEGGQNEIGNELGDALGIIRSNEMIEASKITGVKAYHLSNTTSDPIYDFGFSKSPDETLEKWGEELTYERFIRFIRTYKPDIVMPSFRNVDSQHGHHRAITILSERAFEDAANPNVFPEHFEEGLSTWQIKKLYLPAESKETSTTSIEIGNYDPIYGMTYTQLGEMSRYMHKSQGMGRDIPVEPRQVHLELVKTSVESNNQELFSGIPYDFREWGQLINYKGLSNQLSQLQEKLDYLVSLYPNRESVYNESLLVLDEIQKLITKVRKAKLNDSLKEDLLHKLEIKESQLNDVIFISSNLEVTLSIDTNVLTRGEEVTVTVELLNNGSQRIKHIQTTLETPAQWFNEGIVKLKHLDPGKKERLQFKITVSEDEAFYHPYKEDFIKSLITFKDKGVEVKSLIEFEDTVAVLPKLSLSTQPESIIVNTLDIQEEIPVTVKVKNYASKGTSATVSLNLPEGWTSNPKQKDVFLEERLSEKEVILNIKPPKHVKKGEFNITAKAETDGEIFDNTVQEISYDHINNEYFIYQSTIKAAAFDLNIPDQLKVGYIESGFDNIANHLIDLGFDVTKLSETELSRGDLSIYDTIVVGIRANLSRPDLVENNQSLLDYVRNGGHVVMQYHKPGDNWDTIRTPPYPIKIGTPSIRWRVTDETAPVTMLNPDHKLFNYPNKITESDWDHWVQERGLYFPMEWDKKYETFVSMGDPNEEPLTSGILMAKYGQGTYLYTSLVFYRQLDHQVAGGYRIFTNLISYGLEQ